jgi:hypothetical protein
MRLDPTHDLTDQDNTAPASDVRPVFLFDGETHGAMVEREAQHLGLFEAFKARFLRKRLLPVPYTSSICTTDGETAASHAKAVRCFAAFACTECGLPLAEKPDACGWIFEGKAIAGGGRLGGALMCTSCVHAVCKFCPHMWVAAREDKPSFVLRRVYSPDQYTEERGYLQASADAETFTYEQFNEYRAKLLREQRQG